MSHQTGSRSGYTVEYLNSDKIWKTLYPQEFSNEGIPLAHWDHDSWINAMLRVMSYEAAVALIAYKKACSFKDAFTNYRIKRWDVTYDLKATETEDTAKYIDNLFERKP